MHCNTPYNLHHGGHRDLSCPSDMTKFTCRTPTGVWNLRKKKSICTHLVVQVHTLCPIAYTPWRTTRCMHRRIRQMHLPYMLGHDMSCILRCTHHDNVHLLCSQHTHLRTRRVIRCVCIYIYTYVYI